MADYSLTEVFGGKNSKEYSTYKEGQKAGKWSDYGDYLAKGGNSKMSPDKALDANISKLVSANQQAIQPAISSYQAQIPETQQAYTERRSQLEAEKTPLKQRFDNLLAKVKSTFQGQRDLATTTTSNELGRRGIVGSSGIADREMQQALAPIFQAEGQATTDIGLEQESSLRQLENMISNMTIEEQSAIRGIMNAMGTMQSQAGLAGVSQGIQGTQFNQNQAMQQQQIKNVMEQFTKTFGLQESGQDLQKKIFELISLPTSQANIAQINSNIANSGSDVILNPEKLLNFLFPGLLPSYVSTGEYEVVKP